MRDSVADAELVIRRARVGSASVDIRVRGGRIAEVAEWVPRPRGVREVDAAGGEVIPGLHDHHVHLGALAAAAGSVRAGPPEVTEVAGLRRALRQAAGQVGPGGWVRAVGYHESVAGLIDRSFLDSCAPDVMVRVQHRSGALWVLNSLALRLAGVEEETSPGVERDAAGRPTGRLWRMDAWLGRRIGELQTGCGGPDPHSKRRRRWAALGREAAALGVTGWTDATPDREEGLTAELCEAVVSGEVPQRLHLMLPLGTSLPHRSARVTAGPVKVLLDEERLPGLEELSRLVADSHREARGVAIHCVTRAELVLALAAFEAARDPRLPAGARGSSTGSFQGDRIEHGAVVPAELIGSVAALELNVVTQANFVFERGDQYLETVEEEDLGDLWRAGSLLAGGVRVAAGSDAPFGTADPWVGVRAATRRQTRSGRLLGPEEAVDTKTALRWWWGTPEAPCASRRVMPGQPADLVVLGAPLGEALAGDGPVPVRATVIGGRVVFHADEA